MEARTRRRLVWAPRILGLLFAGFLSLFALDAFSEHDGFVSIAVALLMHLVPTFVVLVVLAVAWRREWFGALGFAALGVLYVVWTRGSFPMATYLAISGPLFVIAGLFVAGWAGCTRAGAVR